MRYRHDPADPASLSYDQVYSIHQDQAGVLWVGTDGGGLNRYDPAQDAFIRYRHDPADPTSLGHDRAFSIYQDQSGVLWVGTDGGGLNRYDPARDAFVRYRHDPADPTSLSHDHVHSIYQDRSGVLWVGTWGGGLNKVGDHVRAIALYTADPLDPASLSSSDIWAIHEDHLGVLWVGTEGHGLNRYDRKEDTVIHYRHDPANPTSLADDVVWAVYEDSSNRLWIGTQSGLSRYDRARDAFTHYRHDPADPTSLGADGIWWIHEDQLGALWVSTWSLGLDRFDRTTGRFTHYRHDPTDPNSLSNDAVWSIYTDRSGVVWVGTEGGLNRYDSERDAFTHYRHDPDDPASLSDDTAWSIYEDRSGNLWVGTEGFGLNRFDRLAKRFVRYTEQDGLANNVVYGILEDDLGFLWLSTNGGLSKFDPTTLAFRTYDARDGLQSNEFNSGAFHKSRSGEMFFGGIKGFNAFYPERITDNSTEPPVVLTSFRKFNQEVVLDAALAEVTEITLHYADDLISFEFAALDYTASEKNQYAYQLEGLSDGWAMLGTNRSITFTNLYPGSYTLRVKGSNNDGVWNEAGLAVGLIVVPPYWQTWWFRVLGLCMFAGLLVAVYQIRIRNIRERNLTLEERVRQRTEAVSQLSGGVAHDFNNILVAMRLYGEMLEKDLPTAAGEHRQWVGEILAAVRRASDLTAQLLMFNRQQRVSEEVIDVNAAIRGLRGMLNRLVEGNTRIDFALNEVPPILLNLRQFEQIIMNLAVTPVMPCRVAGP